MAKIGQIIIKVITDIILAFLTIAVIIMAYSFFVINIQKKDYVNYFGYTIYEVATGSMADAINIDDLIVVKLNAPYKVGDIITYKNDKDYITHRIIRIDEYTKVLTTKGDANNTEDSNVNPNQVIGKVTKIIPRLGVWKKVVMTPKVMILMFATLVLFNFAFSYNKKKEKKKEESIINQKEDNKIIGTDTNSNIVSMVFPSVNTNTSVTKIEVKEAPKKEIKVKKIKVKKKKVKLPFRK